MASQSAAGSNCTARKSIILFSDGTGNSSSKLQKTNVWRLYEALDLGYPANQSAMDELREACGPDAPNVHDEIQLASYDDGVGTSAFSLLAILGGIFGFGLSRNVRDLYKFLCRNYNDGDRIYAFGFSRGAYTIRLLVSLICTMGVAKYRNEAKLDRDARDMWREYRRFFHTNNRFTDLLVATGRALVRGIIRLWRWPGGHGYARCVPEKLRGGCFLVEWWNYWFTKSASDVDSRQIPAAGPEIEFVGVWDTVAAYGGPIVELTRAVDEWIWPLTMPNYRLSAKVKRARHALAIDDKRDAFTPLLWDEVHEREEGQRLKAEWWKAPAGERAALRELAVRYNSRLSPRLQQVWFVGMHADVGGGYSDDALSLVSLWWMIEHAEQAGLRLLPLPRRRVENVRNIFGPVHDSRGGAGAFYRYQPRYINAWIDSPRNARGGKRVHAATQTYRDPNIDRDPETNRGRYETRGLLCEPIRLHRSVEERLKSSTDGYGPNNLPPAYVVDDGVRGLSEPEARPEFSVSLILELGDRIRIRRFWYFMSLLVVLALALKPFWDSIPVLNWIGGSVDARTDAQIVESGLNIFLPEFAEKWTHALASDPYVSSLFIGLLVAFTMLGVGHERKMVDTSRRMWGHRFLGGAEPRSEIEGRNPITRFWHCFWRQYRRSDTLQFLLAKWKWRTVPVMLGLAMWLTLFGVVVAGFTQLWLVWAEQRPDLCTTPGTAKTRGPVTSSVPLYDSCAPLGMRIDRSEVEQSYRITIEMLDGNGRPGQWLDQKSPATPLGWDNPVSHEVKQWLGEHWYTAWMPDWLATWLARGPHDGTKFLRRVVSYDLMQPVLEIREKANSPDCWRPVFPEFFGDCIYMLVPELKRRPDAVTYAGEFTVSPGKHGEFYFFVNDVVLPIDPGVPDDLPCPSVKDKGWKFFQISGRYANNCGKAKVTLERLD